MGPPGWFDGFRDNGWNSYYAEQKTPVWGDVRQILIICCSVILGATLLVIVLGTRGKERWSTFFKLVFNLHIGVVILVTVYGEFWQYATVDTYCDYYVTNDVGLQADVGMLVGLKSINVTLEVSSNETHGSSIQYNEYFSIDQVEDMRENLLEAKKRGLPGGILYVLEYLAFDGGGLRWTRILRLNGHFVHILLWTALVSWLIGAAMLTFVTTRGALLLVLTGSLMFLSCVTYHANQPEQLLVVPFEDTQMELRYGWCFWLCGISGVCTMLAGASIISVLTWCSETTCVRLLGCGKEDEEEDMYDLPRHNKGPLELDTPFQERKKSIKYYNNRGYQPDEEMREKPDINAHSIPHLPYPHLNGHMTSPQHAPPTAKQRARPKSPVAVIIDSSDDEPLGGATSGLPEVGNRAAPIYSLLDPHEFLRRSNRSQEPTPSYRSSRDPSPNTRDSTSPSMSINMNRYSSSSGHVTGSAGIPSERSSDIPEYSTPERTIPEYSTPEVDIPEFNTPEIIIPEFSAPDVGSDDFPESIWRDEGGERGGDVGEPEPTDEELSQAGWTESPDTLPVSDTPDISNPLEEASEEGQDQLISGNCKTVIDLQSNEISYNNGQDEQ